MLGGWFGGKKDGPQRTSSVASFDAAGAATSVPAELVPGRARIGAEDELTILVIQQDAYDWAKIFAAAVREHELGDRLPRLAVVQTSWDDIEVGAVDNDRFHTGPLYDGLPQRFTRFPVLVRKQWRDGKEVEAKDKRPITVFPNFVLIRNEFQLPTKSFRAQLLALSYADCPSLNAIQSTLMMADKPVMQGALHRLRNTRYVDRPEDFPVIAQMFAPSHNAFFYGREFPAVVKFGSAHAGMGKLKVADHHAMEDVKTTLPLIKDGFATAEPFVEGCGDLRLQKLGKHHRAFFRRSTCGAWKTNTQSSLLTEVPVTPLMVEWLEAVSMMFGRDPRNRLLILTIDAVVAPPSRDEGDEDDDGAAHPPSVEHAEAAAGIVEGDDVLQLADLRRAQILEVNGTSSGLSPETAVEDNGFIAELVLDQLAAMLRITVAHNELVPCTSDVMPGSP